MNINEVKDDRPEIIVFIGLPGSGKSTYIKEMLSTSNVDYVIVSSDNEIERLAEEAGLDYNSGFDRFIGKATMLMKQTFRNALNNGSNIIWDQTNLSVKKRRGILQKIPDNYRKSAIAFDLTGEELQHRLDKREKETGKSIPPYIVKSMAKSYSPPTKEEGFDSVLIF